MKSGKGSRRFKVTKRAAKLQDSSEEEPEDVVANAYTRLLHDLKTNTNDELLRQLRTAKRRRLDNIVDSEVQDKGESDEPIPSLPSADPKETTTSSSPTPPEELTLTANKEQSAEDQNARHRSANTTRRRFEKILTADEAAASGKEKDVRKLSEAIYNSPKTSWEVSGPPVQVHAALEDYVIQPRLQTLWKEHLEGGVKSPADFGSPHQQAIFALANSYKDILHTNYPYPSSLDFRDQTMDAILLHCLDHVSSSAQRIKKNNEALKADPSMEAPRDQGYTRPKVLLLLPMRNVAYKVVSRLLVLAQKETRKDSIQGKARFLEDFGPQEEEEDEKTKNRSQEHRVLFHGNTDDHFRLGIKLTRGAVKLYADFFQSDIIVASPIALATKQAEAEGKSEEDLDFLSSIEVAVAIRCDVMQMQNWSHVRTVFEALNMLPKDLHGVDVMRVREWYLQGQAKQYRQTILLSSFCFPELKALFQGHCRSHSGMAKIQTEYEGVIGSSSMHVHQVFERFGAHDAVDDIDRRFEHFKARIWPRIRDSGSAGQMVFVPSYLDYVRLRSFLRAEEFEFEGLSEYASGSEVARGRSRFAAGTVRLALYTERAHFYHRRQTRGVKDLYLYQLPEHGHYYNELVGLLVPDTESDAGHSTVTVIFSKLDVLRLERVVGSRNAKKMQKAPSKTFMFSQL